MTCRLLVLLFALLLPLQMSWAAAGAYCEHESSPADARHFGHHAHVHDDEGKAAEGKKAAGKTTVDSDCGFCHAGSPAGLAGAGPDLPGLSARSGQVRHAASAYPSPLLRTPDRPQWSRLA